MDSRIVRIFASIGFGAVAVIGYLAALLLVVFTSDPSSVWPQIMRLPVAGQYWIYTNWIVPIFVKSPMTYEYYYAEISNIGAAVCLGILWTFVSIIAYIGSAAHDSRLSCRLP